MHFAAVGTSHFQRCFPGRTQTLRVRLDAGRYLLIGFGANEEKLSHWHPEGSQPPMELYSESSQESVKWNFAWGGAVVSWVGSGDFEVHRAASRDFRVDARHESPCEKQLNSR